MKGDWDVEAGYRERGLVAVRSILLSTHFLCLPGTIPTQPDSNQSEDFVLFSAGTQERRRREQLSPNPRRNDPSPGQVLI